MFRNRPFLKFILFAVGLVAVDQIIKLAVKLNMELGNNFPWIDGIEWARIHFLENRGAAFGFTFEGLFGSEDIAKLLLTLLSLGLCALICLFLWKERKRTNALPWLVAAVLGGAFGNIVDRVFYGVLFQDINAYFGGLLHGRVVDMFYVDPFNGNLWGMTYSMPVWNFADACITIGIILILIFQRRLFRVDAPVVEPTPEVVAQDNQLR